MNLVQRLTNLSLCNTHKAFESVIFELSMSVNITANSMSLSSKQGPSTPTHLVWKPFYHLICLSSSGDLSADLKPNENV